MVVVVVVKRGERKLPLSPAFPPLPHPPTPTAPPLNPEAYHAP